MQLLKNHFWWIVKKSRLKFWAILLLNVMFKYQKMRVFEEMLVANVWTNYHSNQVYNFPVFNTNCSRGNICDADQFCQVFHNDTDLRNGISNTLGQCDLCLQWYHAKCLTINFIQMK